MTLQSLPTGNSQLPTGNYQFSPLFPSLFTEKDYSGIYLSSKFFRFTFSSQFSRKIKEAGWQSARLFWDSTQSVLKIDFFLTLNETDRSLVNLKIDPQFRVYFSCTPLNSLIKETGRYLCLTPDSKEASFVFLLAPKEDRPLPSSFSFSPIVSSLSNSKYYGLTLTQNSVFYFSKPILQLIKKNDWHYFNLAYDEKRQAIEIVFAAAKEQLASAQRLFSFNFFPSYQTFYTKFLATHLPYGRYVLSPFSSTFIPNPAIFHLVSKK